MKKAAKTQPARLDQTPSFLISGIKQRTLLDIQYPPGFDKNGRRILAKCPEFKLVEMYEIGGKVILETSDKIETALMQALFRINSAFEKGDTGKRIQWAMALRKLHLFTTLGRDRGYMPIALGLAATLGEEVDDVLKSTSPEDAAEKAGRKFTNAILALARQAGKIEDKRSSKAVSAEAVLIWEAQGNFQYYRKRPTKSDLRRRLELIGFDIKGNDIKRRWEERFRAAALDKLPT